MPKLTKAVVNVETALKMRDQKVRAQLRCPDCGGIVVAHTTSHGGRAAAHFEHKAWTAACKFTHRRGTTGYSTTRKSV